MPDRKVVYFGLILAALLSITPAAQAQDDRLEPVNRAVYEVNARLYEEVINPAARYYRDHVPPSVRAGVSNVFANLREPMTALYSLLEGDFKNTGAATARFAINTTLGVGGIFDPATEMGVTSRLRHVKHVLCTYGVPEGDFLVLPIYGPTTVRNAAGAVFEVLMMADMIGNIYYPLAAGDLTVIHLDRTDQQDLMVDPYERQKERYRQLYGTDCGGPDPHRHGPAPQSAEVQEPAGDADQRVAETAPAPASHQADDSSPGPASDAAMVPVASTAGGPPAADAVGPTLVAHAPAAQPVIGLVGPEAPRSAADDKPTANGCAPPEAAAGRNGGGIVNASFAVPRHGAVMDRPRRLADGSVFVPKPAQRLLDIRTQLTCVAEVRQAVPLAGQVIPDPNWSGRVQASQAGRMHPAETGLPYIGMPVTQGQILGYVKPVIPSAERANIKAEIAHLSSEILVARQRLQQFEEFWFVPFRKSKLEISRIQLEGLRKRRQQLIQMFSEQEVLRAPRAGVISVAGVVAGEIVDARHTIFEIVDPAKLWVEAIAFDPDMVNGIKGASAVTADGVVVPLIHVGSSPAIRHQAIPLRFAVRDAVPGLRVGLPLTVLVEGPRKLASIVLSQDSVVKSAGGETIVWHHVAAERFEPVSVRVQPHDGNTMLVVAGLGPEMRIVAQGAGLLNQVR
ncbi:MAG: MlaA family lipoprotein [Pseudomonadota bacterium]